MKLRGIFPKHQVLDNEISAAYKAKIQATHMTYQLVPPDDHHRNIVEKKIQTCRYHFVSVCTGTAATFLVHLWCQSIPQVDRQFMLIRQSNVNPQISAYAHVYGPHNYDDEQFFPIGMESLVQDNPRQKTSFAEHCKKGYVLGTYFEHYRDWNIWMKSSCTTKFRLLFSQAQISFQSICHTSGRNHCGHRKPDFHTQKQNPLAPTVVVPQ